MLMSIARAVDTFRKALGLRALAKRPRKQTTLFAQHSPEIDHFGATRVCWNSTTCHRPLRFTYTRL